MYIYFEVMFTVLIKRKNNLFLNSHLVEHWTCKSFSSTRFSEKSFLVIINRELFPSALQLMMNRRTTPA